MAVGLEDLRGSDGTGNAVLALVESPRIIGSTVLNVNSVDNWPQEFIATVGTKLGTGFLDTATVTEFRGHLNAGDIVIDSFEPGHVDNGNTTNQVVMIKQTTGWSDSLIDTLRVSLNDNGTIKNAAVGTDMLTAAAKMGWMTGLTVPTATVYLGNHSYQHTYAASIAGFKSPGMRNRYIRTVAAQTQCTDLELSSSQYWSKAAPAGIVFTDDFTAMGWVKLESYSDQAFISRTDNSTGGWWFGINGSGQVILSGHNGAMGNYRRVVSNGSVPLGRWVHIAATLDMSAAAGEIYIDGILVPRSIVVAGSSPGSLNQTGNLQVGALGAAALLGDGKFAQMALFNAVLAQATVRAYQNQTLAGSETNCIGLWKFAGNGNDSTANANNLTASGGAVATIADSPFSLNFLGVPTGNTDYSITQTISADGLTEIVQVPEGNTIPTSGGISALAYATHKTPYGFPTDTAKWTVGSYVFADITYAVAALNAYYEAFPGMRLTVPAGSWRLQKQFIGDQGGTVAAAIAYRSQVGLNPGSTNDTIIELVSRANNGASAGGHTMSNWQETLINIATATTYYHNMSCEAGGGAINFRNFGAAVGAVSYLRAINAYL